MSATAATTMPRSDGDPSPRGLARDDTRVQLVRRLTDVLSLPEGKTTANDRAMVADMMMAAIGTVDPALRAEIAGRLTNAAGLPLCLVRQLLCDVAPVAQAFLDGPAEIPEDVLVEAAAVSIDHRRLLAGRDTVGPALAEALLAYDEAEIVAAVLEGGDVVLGAARVEKLVLRSRTDRQTRKALLARPELRPSQGFAMFWWSGPSDRRRILARFAMDRTVLQDTLQSLFPVVFTADAPDPLVKRLLRLIDRRHRPRGENGEVVTADVVQRTLTAARAAPSQEFCHAIGLVAGIGTDTATRVMHDVGGEPFAILCKSVGLSRGAFQTVLDEAARLPAGDGPRFDERQREGLLATFDTVARDYARAVLQYWDWRPDIAVGAAAAAQAPTSTSNPGDDDTYLGAV